MAKETLTEKQKTFLAEYQATMDLASALGASNMQMCNLRRDIKKDTEFARRYWELRNSVEKDPRFDKAAGLERLMRYQRIAEEKEDFKLAIEIQKEINKMVDGNIAATTQRVEKNEKIEVKCFDFTERRRLANKPVLKEIQEAEIVDDE
jgi:nitrate reductase alpha subunit